MTKCKITLEYECAKDWNELPESVESHRFCDKCEQNVYWVDSIEGANKHAEAGHCIAYEGYGGSIIMGPPPRPTNTDIPDELVRAYLATKYCASTLRGEISILIGDQHPALDSLLEEHGASEWAFITAWNPYSEEIDPAENAARHKALTQKVSELGYLAYEGAGIPDDTDWQPEASLLILGIDATAAVELGKKFGQNAIVLGEIAQPAELISCR